MAVSGVESELAGVLAPQDVLKKLSDTNYRITMQRSDVRELLVDVLLDGYPESPALLQLKSKKLQLEVVEKVEVLVQQTANGKKGEPHLFACYSVLNQMLGSRLISAYSEIQAVKPTLAPQDQVTRREKAGVIIYHLNEGPLSVKLTVTVPDNYPFDQITFKAEADGLTPEITTLFSSQGIEIVRRLHAGYEAGLGVINSVKEIQVVNTEMSVIEMKHDVDFIREKHQLERLQGHKDARRGIKRLLKNGIEEETAKIEELITTSEEAARPPRPQLRALIGHWVKIVRTMPSEICLACGLGILGTTKIERIICGHWIHNKCLEQFMCTPPWIKMCQFCGQAVGHVAFPCDEASIKKRERQHTMEEAKQRELSDVFELFG